MNVTLTWCDERTFEDPVLVDLRTGRVYEFPKRRIVREEDVSVIPFLPSVDSPCLLADRASLDLQ